MNRRLVGAGAIALVLLQPAAALAAPTAVVRGGPMAPPPPRISASRSAGQDFKVPFHVDARPKPVESETQPMLLPYRWHAWQYSPQYLWNQSAWGQNGCFADNLFGVPSTLPSGTSLPANITIGSLVDDRSKQILSSTPSYDQSLPLTGGAVATLQPTSCGSASLINF
ncbi:MAG TPA: hypothetical protein VKR56_03115 [Candidatus Cybelea sp.]|nr:hypothetical protein [Candidatus Cybelea sp.]